MSINNYIEESDSLFHFIDDKYVCENCLLCEGLKYWFQNTYANKESTNCDYCKREVSSLSVIDLQKHILNYFELTPLERFCPRADGEYLLKGILSEDWIDQHVGGAVVDELFVDLYHNATSQYYEREDWQLRDQTQQWQDCWSRYSQSISVNEGEFIIDYTPSEDECELPDYVPPEALPDRAIVAIGKADGFWEMPKGYQLYRLQGEKCSPTFDRLTSAPDNRAGLNRFSLAGVSMFYGAPEENTAAQEIDLKPGDEYTYGLFETTQPLLILDLVNYKKPLGNFDPRWQSQYHIAKFLEGFTKDVSKPITDKANDYLPTQAFCDFIKNKGWEKLSRLSNSAGLESLRGELPDDPILMPLRHNKIHGIRYTSSRNNKESVVLFCNQEKSKDLLIMPDSGHRTCANTPFDNEELFNALENRLTQIEKP